MEFLTYLTQGNVGAFILLLLRFSGIFAFFPFFDNQLISANIKGALIFFMTLLFFPITPTFNAEMTLTEFAISGIKIGRASCRERVYVLV